MMIDHCYVKFKSRCLVTFVGHHSSLITLGSLVSYFSESPLVEKIIFVCSIVVIGNYENEMIGIFQTMTFSKMKVITVFTNSTLRKFTKICERKF